MAVPRTAAGVAAWAAGVLAVAGVVFLSAVGAVVVGALWLPVAALAGWGARVLRHAPGPLRVILAASLIPLLALLTWEGGLFFVPAAIALVLASACAPHAAARPGEQGGSAAA